MYRVLTLVAIVSIVLVGCSETTPQLTMHDSVPADLEALAGEVWGQFLGAFPAQHDCIGEVTLVAAWELDDRAQLDPASRIISVRVPATAPQLSESMIHEFGHLLEFSCPDQASLRTSFQAHVGLPADQDWYEAARWEDVPSEHWAETVVQYVIGSRLAHAGRIPVTSDAVDLVAQWATAG